jgi:DNA-binding HxlR family transcriptional regulator
MDSLLSIIGDQWTLSVIHKLSTGPWRSQDLYASFKGMSTRTLSTRLNRLARAGIVKRKSHPERPPRVEFSLTEKGSELLRLLHSIAEVARRWAEDQTMGGFAEPCRACVENAGGSRPNVAGVKSNPFQADPQKIRKKRDRTLL